jgi:hypothetical protein
MTGVRLEQHQWLSPRDYPTNPGCHGINVLTVSTNISVYLRM